VVHIQQKNVLNGRPYTVPMWDRSLRCCNCSKKNLCSAEQNVVLWSKGLHNMMTRLHVICTILQSSLHFLCNLTVKKPKSRRGSTIEFSPKLLNDTPCKDPRMNEPKTGACCNLLCKECHLPCCPIVTKFKVPSAVQY
jgi:hypothetical protein